VILQSVAWLALANSVVCAIALGLASLTGSRPGTITALIGWELVLSPLVALASSLGSLRRGVLDSVLMFLKPGPATGRPVIPMPVVVAIVVTVVWLLIASAAGAWRMQTPGRLTFGVTLTACGRSPQRWRRCATRSAAIRGGSTRCSRSS
jgi:hypothetical protein